MPKQPLRLFARAHRPEPLAIELTEEDLYDQLGGKKSSSLFMGHFEKARVLAAFERFGITPHLTERGYRDLHLEFHARGPREHFMRMYDTTEEEQALLGEVVLREGRFAPEKQAFPGDELPPCDVLAIEWILMQDIHGRFGDDRRRLPGQHHPGLGLGKKVMDLLIWVATLLEIDAIMNVPEYFHNAVFYDQWFLFVDPAKQGELEAILAQLGAQGFDLVDISFAAYLDSLTDRKTGEPFIWQTSEQMFPRREACQAYFDQPAYAVRVAERRAELDLTINKERFAQKLAEHDPRNEG
jgi:hypothetical protein